MSQVVAKLHNNLDKVLIGVAALVLAVSGWQIYSYRSYVNCQIKVNDTVVKALDANEEVTKAFRESMNILLARPPKSQDEQRAVLEKLRVALNHQQEIMATIPPVPSRACG